MIDRYALTSPNVQKVFIALEELFGRGKYARA
jgi:hypothetical protein